MTIKPALLFCFLLGRISAADPPATPQFESAVSLEAFLFSTADDQTKTPLAAAFNLDQAGMLLATAASMGPAYASKVAAIVPQEEYRRSYAELARHLDLFGPCQKRQTPDKQGWWSNYPDPPEEHYCSEATKILLSTLLWTQVHYCRQLLAGEVEPKSGGPFPPRPWSLHQPPAQSAWLRTGTLYAMADAAVRLDFSRTLSSRAGKAEGELKRDLDGAISELAAQQPQRDLVALALAKVLLRHYQAVHAAHMRKLRDGLAKP